MKLAEALNLTKSVRQRAGEPVTYFLAAGFNPLHLNTFLAAELGLVFADRKIELQTGLYGDLLGNLSRLANASADTGIVVIEWADLDARLGFRSSGIWSPSDILATVRNRSAEVLRAIDQACSRMPVVVCFPTLPLLPVSFPPGWQASSFEIELHGIVQAVRSQLSQNKRVRVLSSQRIDMISPMSDRMDVESELLTGFPYRMAHASALANLLAQLARRPTPKKGLITDLDDTLWRGILGEVGIDGVSWDLDHHSQMHAFYQRLLGSFAEEGVLLAIASKNERSLVERALSRKDLALPSKIFFPLEVSWGPKSEAVTRILNVWNVGADSVIFIDDSPLELAEVKASHPGVECLQFPTNDATAIYKAALRLRDWFGKSAILEEDKIRAQSIRSSHAGAHAHEPSNLPSTTFLENVEAQTSFNFDKSPLDPRALDLVNKTNQFNLNGKRYTETSWEDYFANPQSVLLMASYQDKFGPLGKIAVIAGTLGEKKLTIDSWVMSCRAFSRRIEYACLEELFSMFGLEEIELDYMRTDRNGPLSEFLGEVLGEAPWPGCMISRQLFEANSKTAREPQEMING